MTIKNISFHNKYSKIGYIDCWGMIAVLAMGLLCHGCGYSQIDEATYFETTQRKLNHYQLHLPDESSLYWRYNEIQPVTSWISLSVIPWELYPQNDESEESLEHEQSVKVKPTKTPWAAAWDRSSVVRRMDEILRDNGVVSETIRVHMIAHAIVASGWKQNVWNYNAWGVKQGSWEKSWYMMPTYEEDENGNDVFVEDAAWRSFENWPEAIADFQSRISADSERPAYREAYAHLTEEKFRFKTAKAYWEALGKGNYYTASKFTGKKFARLCGGVRAILR